MLTLENELAALIHIREVAQDALNKYPTTIEEDDKILKKDEKLNRLGYLKTCILFRKSEKFALKFLIDCSRKV